MNTNYQKEMEEQLKHIKKGSKLLLHTCCGPCSSYVLDYLNKHFDITIVYYNPNIYPKEEYFKRYDEQKRIIKEMFNDEIKILEVDYNPDEYENVVQGYEEYPEGSKRCHLCYKLRLEKTVQLAKQYNFDYFTTTLSVSPYKNSKVLNEIGIELSNKYNVNYLFSDFKKNDGYKKSIEFSKKYDLYRQDYCGCKYSLKVKSLQ